MSTPTLSTPMNILYCGDSNIRDGVLVSVLSLLANQNADVHIFIATADFSTDKKHYRAVDQYFVDKLSDLVAQERPDGNSGVTLIDATDAFCAQIPAANMSTRFTPCCMLRLYADLFDEFDACDRVLYLDNDILCKADPTELYIDDLKGAQIAGALDRYGRWFFHNELRSWDYLNSGVLLMDMDRIRADGLLARCRDLCATKKMFMPDQSALNKLAKPKRIVARRFNEQGDLRRDTVFQHFSTRFSATGMLSVKPWEVDKVHRILKLHAYDDILQKYQDIKSDIIKY